MMRCAVLVAVLASCSSQEQGRPAPSSPDAGVPPADLVAVPAGWFTAGCASSPAYPSAADSCIRSNPPRRVWVSSFEIDRLEITRAAYRSCVDAGACRGSLAAFFGDREDEHRGAARVTFLEAEAYCRWRGERLPTLSEWEKAARGTADARVFPWGDAMPDCTRSWRTGQMDASAACPFDGPVGSHPAGRSPYGVEDLYGGAPEWTSTYFSEAFREPDVGIEYEQVDREGRTHFLASWTQRRRVLDPTVVDPVGPPSQGQGHVVKGATGIEGQIGANEAEAGDNEVSAGFRCVRSVPGPAAPVVEMPPPGTAIAPYREPGFEP